LRSIADSGADAVLQGKLGESIRRFLSMPGTWLTEEDIRNYRVIRRDPVRGTYRGHEILGRGPIKRQRDSLSAAVLIPSPQAGGGIACGVTN
jgi:gamma-glutamyltranspeptidase